MTYAKEVSSDLPSISRVYIFDHCAVSEFLFFLWVVYKSAMLWPKSLYVSCFLSNFYAIEIEIWAGFGPVGNFSYGPILFIMINFF